MGEKICGFICALIYENGIPSLTRVLSMVSFCAFLLGSAYLMINGQTWQHYDTFAFITGGGGTTAQVFNKYFNTKFNAKPGELYTKNNDTPQVTVQTKVFTNGKEEKW